MRLLLPTQSSGDFGAAIRGYATALRRDSTFALAALHEALAADRTAALMSSHPHAATAFAQSAEVSGFHVAFLGGSILMAAAAAIR